MLGDKISNQDEDEVEEELAALEAELGGREPTTAAPLPNVPNTELKEDTTQAELEVQPARVRQEERQAMLA
jgi:charged multivesicular body protein 6